MRLREKTDAQARVIERHDNARERVEDLEKALARAELETLRLTDDRDRERARANKAEKDIARLKEDLAAIPDKVDVAGEGALEQLKTEHAALAKNYATVKRQYAALQDEVEALEANTTSGDKPADEVESLKAEVASLTSDLYVLKQENSTLQKDREAIRNRLDAAIEQVELLVGEDA